MLVYNFIIFSCKHSLLIQFSDAAPVILETFEERTLQPGPSISLKCVASGSPLPEIRWTLDGVEVPKHERIQVGDFIAARNGDVTSHVNISNVRADDGGYYSCTAKNKIGIVKHGGRLNIFGVPYIREMANRSVISGKTLNMQCPVAGYPIQTIVWQRGRHSFFSLPIFRCFLHFRIRFPYVKVTCEISTFGWDKLAIGGD